jgi:hypothetical protein
VEEYGGKPYAQWSKVEKDEFFRTRTNEGVRNIKKEAYSKLLTEGIGSSETLFNEAIAIIDNILRDMDEKGAAPFDEVNRDTPEMLALRERMQQPSGSYMDARE